MGVKTLAGIGLVAVAFGIGIAQGQDSGGLADRLQAVRREIKHVDLDEALGRLPALLEREHRYNDLVGALGKTAKTDAAQYKLLLSQGRQMKLGLLKDLNGILARHKSKYVGITEEEVWSRLKSARFRDVSYDDEWLVNILDDLEERCKINIELDARIYKFDTVTFEFDRTSARAMLQIMGDTLLFNWIVRGDTLYVYKERNEVLFGGEWLRKKKAAFRARKAALKKASAEAEKRALGGEGKKEEGK